MSDFLTNLVAGAETVLEPRLASRFETMGEAALETQVEQVEAESTPTPSPLLPPISPIIPSARPTQSPPASPPPEVHIHQIKEEAKPLQPIPSPLQERVIERLVPGPGADLPTAQETPIIEPRALPVEKIVESSHTIEKSLEVRLETLREVLVPQALPLLQPPAPPAMPVTQVVREGISQPQSAEPTIQVTIGRIEVRAAPPGKPQARPEKPRGILSLEDYLKRRGEA